MLCKTISSFKMVNMKLLTMRSSLSSVIFFTGVVIIFILLRPSKSFVDWRNNSLFGITTTTFNHQRSSKFSIRSPSLACKSTLVNQCDIESNNSFDIYRKELLGWYCDILPIPLYKWTGAKTYTERDIAFVIFTGLPFYRNRAVALQDTWISRASTYYFLSATPDHYLPITLVAGAGEDKLSNMKKLFYGLQIIYRQQMLLSSSDRQKWFYIAGCDTFIFVPHLLKRLDGYNYMQPLLIGSDIGLERCPGDNNTTFLIPFPSGGAGFFFSFKLLEMVQPHLSDYLENIWFPGSTLSDVALTCLAFRLGVNLTNSSGFWRDTPLKTLQEHGRGKLHSDSEINSFHYVPPEEMYVLDEFYVLQHVQRLVLSNDINELHQFINRFITAHYKLMRKKKEKCILPLSTNVSASVT